jgi:hypothetical protein
MASEHSDYDFVMLVKDEVLAEYEERYSKKVSPKIEGWVVTLETFRNHPDLPRFFGPRLT